MWRDAADDPRHQCAGVQGGGSDCGHAPYRVLEWGWQAAGVLFRVLGLEDGVLVRLHYRPVAALDEPWE